MVRARELKRRLGRRIRERVIDYRLVPGYEAARDPGRGWELWRTLMIEKALVLDAVRESGHLTNVVRKPGTLEIEAVELLPRDAVYIYVQVNPARLPAALHHTLAVVAETLYKLVGIDPGDAAAVRAAVVHPKNAFLSGLSRHRRTRFHVIDADDKSLAERLLEVFQRDLGYRPAMITTSRGAHLLVDLEKLREKRLIGRYAGAMSSEMRRAYRRIADAVRQGGISREEAIQEALAWLENAKEPLYYRVRLLSEATLDRETGARLVELKEQGLEPLPGQVYKGVLARFTPDEA